MKWQTIDGLARAEMVRYGDLLDGLRGYTGEKKLHWMSRRARLLRQPLRATIDGVFPTGRPRYRIDDTTTDRSWFINNAQRIYLYQNGLAHRGYDLADTYAATKITYRPNDIVLDSGANYADLQLYFAFAMPEVPIRYIAIEPGFEEAECIRLNLADSGDEVWPYALGAEDRQETFHYAPDSLASRSSLKPWPGVSYSEHTIDVVTLDTLLEREGLLGHRIRLLKLAAEGSELEALQGATRTLGQFDYVAIDMGRRATPDHPVPAPEIIPLMLDRGFVIDTIGDPRSLRFLFRNRDVRVGSED